ncbi:MAG: PorT family protein [Candidatus Marinimicrobia bacterium]|nr:PorT family protein [Candidatus Neomarinimicrobiota bacterium]MBL7046633.1 PorT family protein [Candidatus Neomarinimicrobiota bacterium]
MKKYKIAAMVATVIFTFLLPENIFGGGIKIGYNLNDVSGSEAEWEGYTKKQTPGFTLNLFTTNALSENLALQPEIALTLGKGVKYEDDEGHIDISYLMAYVESSILFKYMLLPDGTFSPSLYAGPVIGYQIQPDVWFDNHDNDTELDYKIVNGNPLELGLSVGFETRLKAFVLDFRYFMGFTSFLKEHDPEADYDPEDEVQIEFYGENNNPMEPDIKNNVIMLMLGYDF